MEERKKVLEKMAMGQPSVTVIIAGAGKPMGEKPKGFKCPHCGYSPEEMKEEDGEEKEPIEK